MKRLCKISPFKHFSIKVDCIDKNKKYHTFKNNRNI